MNITHNPNLIYQNELKSIEINNLIEIKDVKDLILIEFAKEFIFNSNNIEGKDKKIPAEEVKKIIKTGYNIYKNRNEIKKIYNSIHAFNYIQKGFRFNISSIKRFYYLLKNDMMMPNGGSYPKGFKKGENVINNESTVHSDHVEKTLTDLFDEYKKIKKTEYPLKLAFDFHLRYEYIHPFLDGNKRTKRLIMNKILMSKGYFPIIIYTNNAKAYFNAISQGLKRKSRKNYC